MNTYRFVRCVKINTYNFDTLSGISLDAPLAHIKGLNVKNRKKTS